MGGQNLHLAFVGRIGNSAISITGARIPATSFPIGTKVFSSAGPNLGVRTRHLGPPSIPSFMATA